MLMVIIIIVVLIVLTLVTVLDNFLVKKEQEYKNKQLQELKTCIYKANDLDWCYNLQR